MGRGKHFKHKLKGYDHKIPEHGLPVNAKREEHVVYDIESVATADTPAVSFKVIKE